MAAKTKRIKILFTIPNFDTAGSGKAMLKIAQGLDKSHFDAHISCLHSEGVFFKVVEESGLPIHLFPFINPARPLANLLINSWKASRFFKKHRFDLIHSFHYSSDYSEPLAAKLAGIKWVFTKKNMNWGGSSANSWKLRGWLASHIAVQNTDMMKSFYPESRKTFFIPRGVDIGEFVPRSPDESILEELGITKDVRVILNVANMVPVKRIDVLVRAFKKIDDKKAVLVLVGDDKSEYGLSIHQLVDDLELSDRVVFTGKRFDVARFVSIAHLFVLSTSGKGEGSPVSLLEAMACGIPVVGTDIPGIRDQLASFPELMAKPDDEEHLALKIDELLVMDALNLKELKEKLVRHVHQNYSLSREIENHEKLYRLVLGIGK